MKKVYLFLLLCGLALTACDFGGNTYIGTTKSYAPFLGKTFNWNETTLPEQHLQLSIGEVAFNTHIKLGLFYQSTKDGSWTIPVGKELLIFKNGERLPDNTFTIKPGEKDVTIAFRFQEGAQEKTYKIGVRLLTAGDLDILNGISAQELVNNKQPISNVSWTVKHKMVMNPLKEGLLFGLGGFVAFLLIWIICVKLFVKRFDQMAINFVYVDGDKRSGLQPIYVDKARKVICTNENRSQNLLSKLFTGAVEYAVNPFWTSPLEILPQDDVNAYISDTEVGYRMNTTMLCTTKHHVRTPLVITKAQKDSAQTQAVEVSIQ